MHGRRAPAPAPGQHFHVPLAVRRYHATRRAPQGARDLVADPRDPWPGRLQGIVWGWLLLRAAARRMDPRRLSTVDIEWNGGAFHRDAGQRAAPAAAATPAIPDTARVPR